MENEFKSRTIKAFFAVCMNACDYAHPCSLSANTQHKIPTCDTQQVSPCHLQSDELKTVTKHHQADPGQRGRQWLSPSHWITNGDMTRQP